MAEERNGNELYATFLNIRNCDVIELPENEFSDPVIEKPFVENAKLQGKDGIIFTCKTDNELLKDSFYAVFKPNKYYNHSTIKKSEVSQRQTRNIAATQSHSDTLSLLQNILEVNKNNIRFQIIGEKGAAALDKTEEATTRLDNLKIAQKMTESGKDAKTIRLATGIDKKRSLDWAAERGLQLSPTATNPNFNKNLITKDDFVNNLAQDTTKTKGEEKTMDMDQEIERMQANGGMSEAAMEADIRAEEERAYQEWKRRKVFC